MGQGTQSIEDLISSSHNGDASEESSEGKFRHKQQEIKEKEIERQVQKKS